MSRELLRTFTRGGFHAHENHLPNVGDGVPLHPHEYAHVIFSTVPLRLLVKDDRGEIIDRIVAAGSLPVVEAHVWHGVVAVEPDTRFTCAFPCWQPGADGRPMWLADPKIESSMVKGGPVPDWLARAMAKARETFGG
jgi:hypothetical protein